MDTEKTFTKLSVLVDGDFTVLKVHEYLWKLWDAANKKMLSSITYEKGYRKVYPVDTDKGSMDLGSGQIGNLLEAVFYDGKADLNGKTFHVKSNGKSGIDIRYYFQEVKKKAEPEDEMPYGDDRPY